MLDLEGEKEGENYQIFKTSIQQIIENSSKSITVEQ